MTMCSASSKRVLMCGSSLDYKGGMVTVARNYLDWPDWEEFALDYIPTHVPGGKLRVAAHFAAVYPKIRQLLRSRSVDVVHLHVAERGSFYRKAMIAREAKKAGVPVVLHHHAAEFRLFYDGLDGRAKSYVAETFEIADVNLVLSSAIENDLSGIFPRAKFQVLYNAVDVPSSNLYDPDAEGIAFMGRLGERKGAYDLVKAFARTPDDGHELMLCGDGDVEGVRSLIEELGISGRARCLGWVDPEQRDEVLSRAALNVLPSYNEGLPMSILEAMARGVPTVSTPVAAIPEVVRDGETGLLVAPGDIDGLAAAIGGILSDRAGRERMSASAYRLVRSRHSLDANIGQLKELYRSLC